jgi:hypothetical protein
MINVRKIILKEFVRHPQPHRDIRNLLSKQLTTLSLRFSSHQRLSVFSVSSLRKVFVMITVSSLSLLGSVNTVSAITHANWQHQSSASVTRWAASAVPVGAPASTGPLVMTWTVSGGTARQFFDIVNTGAIEIIGQSFLVTNVYEKSGNAKPPTVTFEACVNGTWQPSSNTCTGSIVLMGSTTTEFFSSLATPLAIGARLSARATTSPGGSSSYTTTFNVLVSRSQVRAATVTNF